MDIETLVARLGEAQYAALRQAVELGKWPDGRRIATDERELLLQAMIAWEARHRPEAQRSGHLPAPDCVQAPDDPGVHTPLKWLH